MDAGDALAVAASFGIATDDATATPLRGGWTNEVWRIEKPSRTVVVRRYRGARLTHESVAFEHAVMDHASAKMPEVAGAVARSRRRDDSSGR